MRRLVLALLFASLAFAQTTSTTPDCQFFASFTGNGTSGSFAANSTATGTPCVKWRITWQTSTAAAFSAFNVNFNGAPNANGAAGTFVLWTGTGTAEVGTNPGTTATNGTFVVGPGTAAQGVYYPWVNVSITGASGTGTINVKVLGYRGATPQPTIAAGTSNVNITQVAGQNAPAMNGAITEFLGCNASTETTLSGTGYNTLVTASGSTTIYVCKIAGTSSSGGNPSTNTWTFAQGTCAGSPTELENLAGITGLDQDFGGALRSASGAAICAKEAVANSDKITVTYAQF